MAGAWTASGDPVWFGGGKLASDLTLPKLRQRWPGPDGRACRQAAGPGGPQARARLHGAGMASGPGRAVLRREVAVAAAAALFESEFFAGLERAGLMVRLHYADTRPGEAAGYAVSLAGMIHHRDGTQVWYGGATLDGSLGLERCAAGGGPGGPGHRGPRRTSPAPRPPTSLATPPRRPPGRAAGSAPGPTEAADIAWAAADVLYAAADATDSGELRRAADEFSRAARAPWGRIPAPSRAGSELRTAAYMLAACAPGRARRTMARLALISALEGLAGAVAELRQAQFRLLQATAAHHAAVGLTTAVAGDAATKAPIVLTTVDTTGPLVTTRRAGARAARRLPRPRPVPGPRRIR